MADSTIPLKQCSRKEQCIHPDGSWLPATPEYFYINRKCSGSLCSACKPCHNARALEWQRANPERQREIKRQTEKRRRSERRLKGLSRRRSREAKHAENSRRRALRKGAVGTFSKADIDIQKRAQTDRKGKLRCWWCSTHLINTWHIDHRIALSRGGTNRPNNLCLTCPHCNMTKGARLPHEWNGRLL